MSDVFSPLTGEVVEINEALQDEPQRVNDDCYGEGWLIRIRMTAPGELGELMDAGDYKKFLDEADPLMGSTSYVAHSPEDLREMLAAVRASSIDELFAEIPGGCTRRGAADAAGRPQRGGGRGGAAPPRRQGHAGDAAGELPRRRTSRPR